MNRLKTNESATKNGYSLHDIRWARLTGIAIGAGGATVFWAAFVTTMKAIFNL